MKSSTRSLTPSGITRSYLLFFLLLVLSNLLYIYNYINAYLNDRQEMLSGVTVKLQKRIEEYRYVTYQLYEKFTTNELAPASPSATGTRLRSDSYLLDKAQRKTDTLIFGKHDSNTDNLALYLSDYLDVLWGPSVETYSLYYLNGQDNSLTMVSTLSTKRLSIHNKESYLNNMVNSRKAEMLQQSNTLDEREGFSDFRKSRYLNTYYFTLQTTFNNPGQLATVIAFDLPIGDILPSNLPPHRFRLISDQNNVFELNANEERHSSYSETKWPWLTINTPLSNAPMKVQFNIPMATLILDIIHNNFWLLLINLALLIVSFSGFHFIHHHYIRPGKHMAAQLAALQQINQEIITHLPLGLLIYRFDNNTVTNSNKIAEYLLPHLSLTKIANIADEHPGPVQVTVNNAVYEIQMVRNHQQPTSALFLIRNLDKEMLVSKKLHQAQREYAKNLSARKVMTSNLSQELNAPLTRLQQLANKLQKNQPEKSSTDIANAIWNESYHARRIIDEIILLTKLENNDWSPKTKEFHLVTHIESVLKKVLPNIRRKGLGLLVYNDQDPELTLNGDAKTLALILSMLLHYAIITTAYGKIILRISRSTTQAELFQFELSDTGYGVTKEVENINYPWQSQPQNDRFSRGSGLTYYLCNQLSKKLGGQLVIHSKPDIGTRYLFNAAFQVLPPKDEHEKLLNGITVFLQITSDEIRNLVIYKLSAFGASAIVAGEHDIKEQYGILLTDDLECTRDYTLLLVSDSDGYEKYTPHRICVNFNLTEALLDAILLLIEQQMAVKAADEEVFPENNGLFSNENPFNSEEYYTLFMDTVPTDVKKLYTAAEEHDFSSLSLTAHRLKGVFAVLDISYGKNLCEQLEQAISRSDSSIIENLIRQIDYFVSRLLQLGKQQYE